jgi:hypothetical protein
VIVDKDIDETKITGIYKSIQAAIREAEPGTVIKITSNLYDESLYIE